MKIGDMVGYINGDGPSGLVLGIWSEWSDSGWDEEQDMQTWAEVLWDDGTIAEHAVDSPGRELEKINENR
tara:strand:- start:3424 stop:3633 length:210 start_codon:yes stop_codon:yes gene_type:complete